jgi:23S rRNA (guanine745-N1)-methyltransferase
MSVTEHHLEESRGVALVAPLLRCPVCGAGLLGEAKVLGCARGHRFDVARQGYVSFAVGRASARAGDTAPMVAARERFLSGGHYAALAAALAEEAAAIASRAGGEASLLDLGAGPGYYAARVLDAIPSALGIALDVSKAAAKRAARAHPRLGAVVADAGALPVRDRVITIALTVFAPRDPAEIRRVLAAGGAWLVAAPTDRHLAELREPLGLLGIETDKRARLLERAGPQLELADERVVERVLELDAAAVEDLVRMGPSAFHIDDEEPARRVAGLGRLPLRVTASFAIARFESRRASCAPAHRGGRR